MIDSNTIENKYRLKIVKTGLASNKSDWTFVVLYYKISLYLTIYHNKRILFII